MRTIEQTFDPAIPVEDIGEHPENPRRGEDAVVAESVEAHGFYGAILVQRSTGRIIAGNTRYRVARDAGAETVPGFWLDVDDDTARRIMLVDNRASDLAAYDDAGLLDLLRELADTPDGLTGTGYDADLLAMLDPTPAPPESFPSFDPDTLEVEHRCPSCGYEWSGRPGGRPTHLPDDADD